MNLNESHKKFRFEAITLHECSVSRRAEGNPDEPGPLTTRGEFSATRVSDDRVTYLVRLDSVLSDVNEEPILEVSTAFNASYGIDSDMPVTEELLDWWAWNGVLFQVHPYLREFLSSMTGRAGLPPAYLPLLVREVDAAESP